MYLQTSKLSTCKGTTSQEEKCILPCCDYRKLNSLVIAGTLIYVGYLCGNLKNGGALSLASNSASAISDGGNNVETRSTGLRSTSNHAPSPASSLDGPLFGLIRSLPVEEVEPPAIRDEVHEGSSWGPLVHKRDKSVTSIALIGERHSGTNWITDHLVDCFGDQVRVEPSFTRFKHWFQFDDPNNNEGAAVIAMFRDPYDWVEVMRQEPHHALDHVDCPIGAPGAGYCKPLEWYDFVSKPWTASQRGTVDRSIIAKAREEKRSLGDEGCLAGYSFQEVIPCDPNDSFERKGHSNIMYELMQDGSQRAFGSIIDLRREKVLNFMKVRKFHGVAAFFPERYEELYQRGTDGFLRTLEKATGLKANCAPFVGKGTVKHKDVDPEFIEWMNTYHDWEAEAMVGYVKRKPVPVPRREGTKMAELILRTESIRERVKKYNEMALNGELSSVNSSLKQRLEAILEEIK